MLKQYTPQPNLMMGMGMGMTMMGQPTVVGSGNDSNNYLDVRNEIHYTDQGSARVDHQFNSNNTAFVRYSADGEHGFMPENLPGFGYLHDNLSQQGIGSYSHIYKPQLLNVATVAVSRLSMDHTTQRRIRTTLRDRWESREWGSGDRKHGAHRTSMCRDTRRSGTATQRHRCMHGTRWWRDATR